MRYFLTKLTFNNYFDWCYNLDQGIFSYFIHLGLPKKCWKVEPYDFNIKFSKSVFHGDLNYTLVFSHEGFSSQLKIKF